MQSSSRNRISEPERPIFFRLKIASLIGLNVISAVFTTALPAEAAERMFVPSLEIREEFNDNIYLTANGKKSDSITTLIPGISLNRNTERTNLELLASLKWHAYQQTRIDSLDYQYQASLNRKLTLRDDLGLNASYSRNNRLDNINLESGIPASSETVMSQYSVSFKRIVTEKSSASVSYSYSNTNYDDQTLISYRTHSAQLSATRDLGSVLPMLKASLTNNLSRTLYRDSVNDNGSLRVGLDKRINEKTSLNISAGGRFTTSSTTVTNPATGSKSEISSDSSGFVGSASLAYTGEKTFGSLNLSHDVSNASGQGATSEITNINLATGIGLTENTSFQTSATYSNSHTVIKGITTSASDARSIRAKADLLYKLSKYFDVNLQYSYYTVIYSNSSTQIDQNSIILKLVGKYPFIF